ncbi:MAG TPA: hypothetical protein VFH03_13720 [Actinoplanes sp.]|nr:hypothetical protein [Actinoplanes sp.]
MGAASFRPTWQQALARGLYFGALTSVLGLAVAVLVAVFAAPPLRLWLLLVTGPPLVGALAGVLLGRRFGTEVSAGGIRTAAHSEAPWSRVVDLRAERRGGRTVVSVYLDSGASMQLAAPYSGGWIAADPRFELKVFTLAQVWRSHRFGGLP